MIVHRPSVSEHEPQGWIINWMTDRLAAYQFRELESSERFGERIFWTNYSNERILEIQYSKKNCRSHHYCDRLITGSRQADYSPNQKFDTTLVHVAYKAMWVSFLTFPIFSFLNYYRSLKVSYFEKHFFSAPPWTGTLLWWRGLSTWMVLGAMLSRA